MSVAPNYRSFEKLDAYQNGQIAKKCGRTIEDNPYSVDKAQLRAAWNKGFKSEKRTGFF